MNYGYVSNANGYGGGYGYVTNNGFVGNSSMHVTQAWGLGR